MSAQSQTLRSICARALRLDTSALGAQRRSRKASTPVNFLVGVRFEAARVQEAPSVVQRVPPADSCFALVSPEGHGGLTLCVKAVPCGQDGRALSLEELIWSSELKS